ncbi:MAG: hypothetical protein AUJ55_07650 [Proteobacteria bacterium CG1_02_64_396]|nr:MAG: hypothetical protein AUJ55_07650 [Proteobacteria bacterium CG1_02_64_396]
MGAGFKSWGGWLLGGLITLTTLVLWAVEPANLEDLERQLLDKRFELRGQLPADDRVVIVAVDNQSVEELGRWPWSRNTMAALLTAIKHNGARAVGFDITFSEDEANPLDILNRDGPKTLPPETLAQVDRLLSPFASELDPDERFASVLADKVLGDGVVLGYFFYALEKQAPDFDEATLKKQLDLIVDSAYSVARLKGNPEELLGYKGYAVEANIPVLSESASSAGYFNFFPDNVDGKVREVPLVIRYRQQCFPNLALQTVREYLDWPSLEVSVDKAGVRSVRLGPTVLPVDPLGRLLINYRGKGKTFRHISARDVLAGDLPADTFQNKIVLIGITADAVYDMRSTPLDPVFPGVEVHANVIDNILGKDFFQRPDMVENGEWVLLLALGLGLTVLFARIPPMAQGAVTVLLVGVLLSGGQWLFNSHGWWFKEVYPLFLVVFLGASLILFRYILDSQEKRFIRSTFERYLSPSVIKEIVARPGLLELGGEERVMTAFFSDIQSFSTFSETMSPKELVAFLNEYLTGMTNIILEEGGTVDKFEGDAIIAFFGAPLPMQDHAVRCCRAALKMQRYLREQEPTWRERGLPPTYTRMGINTGTMVVGNMGSQHRMDYTMMGDNVNLASRLEGVNKAYGTRLLISHYTFQEIKGQFIVRELDSVRVVGKNEPVILFEVVAEKGEVLPPETMQALDLYSRGLSAYRKQRWNDALDAFRKALSITGDDPPSRIMLERLRQFQNHPPPPDWDGVHNLTQK